MLKIIVAKQLTLNAKCLQASKLCLPDKPGKT